MPPNNETDPAIIYGEPAKPNEIPWQAYLLSGVGTTPTSQCGGSLIRPLWVLTAAHCVTNTQWTEVRMGAINKQNMPYRVRAGRLVHTGYNDQTVVNDVALLKLPVAPQMGANIAIIPMATPDMGNFKNIQLRASGFGATVNGGQAPDTLNKVTLIGITNDECRPQHIQPQIVESTMCARWSSRPGQSACHGDSGGPLTVAVNNQHYLAGVASFVSHNGCSSGAAGGFARVTSFRNWIDQQIAQNP